MAYIPPNTNGQKTMANSSPVVLASDQSAVPITDNSGSITVDNGGTFAVQATGTVTANAGTNLNTSALALDATLTGGTQQTKLTDGTNVATVKAASTAAVAADKAVVVAVSPNNTIPVSLASAPTTAVTGTFWQTTQPVSLATNTPTLQSGSTTAVTQATGTNLHTVVDSGTITTVSTVTAVTGITNALPAGTNLMGKVGIDQTTPGTTNAVVDTPVTSGGLLIVTGSVGATATAIKASAGQLYGYHLFNTTAAVAYVQIFNVASGSVTVGTTAPTMSVGIPASGGVTVNWDKGIAFGTAISFACTTTRTGSTGATCDVNFFYK